MEWNNRTLTCHIGLSHCVQRGRDKWTRVPPWFIFLKRNSRPTCNWWLVRVTLVVAFGFFRRHHSLPSNLGETFTNYFKEILLHRNISVWQLRVFQIVDGVCFINQFWPSDKMKKAFGIVVIFFQLFIPFIILVFCYGNIAWMLSRRINTDMTDTNVGNNSVSSKCEPPKHVSGLGKRKQLADVHKDKFQLARRNTIKTLLIVGCCFIVCWSQNQVLYLMFNLGYDLDWNSKYYHFNGFDGICQLHCQSIYLLY